MNDLCQLSISSFPLNIESYKLTFTKAVKGHERSRVNPWGGKEALDKEMAAHSSTLAWRIL